MPPAVACTNRLLLQLWLLKEDSKSSYPEACKWLSRLHSDLHLDDVQLKNAIDCIKGKFLKFPRDSVSSHCFLLEEYDPSFVCDALQKIGVNRDVLLASNPSVIEIPSSYIVDNELVLTLETFKNRNTSYLNKTTFMGEWLARLTGMTQEAATKQLKSTLKKHQQLAKAKHRNPEAFSSFLKLSFSPELEPITHASSQSSTLHNTPITVTNSHTQTENNHNKVTKCSHTQTNSTRSISSCTQTEETQERKKIKFLKDKVKSLEAENLNLTAEVESLQRERLYEKNRSIKKELDSITRKAEDHQKLYQKVETHLNDRISELTTSKRNLEKLNSKQRKNIQRLKTSLDEKDEQISTLLKDIDETRGNVETRTATRRSFSDELRMTVMALQASGVASSKIPTVIDIVSKTLFEQTLDIPHRTTANRIIEESNAMAKLHISECLRDNTNVTLHTDGTSRQKKKYVGQQLTLDDGRVISLGFRVVATEDAETLIDSTVEFLEELTDIYDDITDAERDRLFLEYLQAINSTMSDRASVMKSFCQKFGDLRSLVLGEDVRTNFLFCNAHFMLGLSSACEQAVKGFEEDLIRESGEALGRDKDAMFRNWFNGKLHGEIVGRVLKACLTKILEVGRRQLTEFLDGQFSGDLDSELVKELQSRPKTNLVGEHAFGDLDHDMNVKRNCSLFNRSTTHMLKRNNTIGWLQDKDEEERKKLMNKSRQLGKKLRLKYKKQEEVVRLKIREKLIEIERKKHEKEMKKVKEKQQIVNMVMNDGGVCKTRKDVEKLKNANSLKAQLRYHKIILGIKDIQIGGTKEQLQQRLVVFLEEGRIVKGDILLPPTKRRRLNSESDPEFELQDEIESVSENETDVNSDDDGSEEVNKGVDSFEFTVQGMWVAVFYDDAFYIGQVLDVGEDKKKAVVKFMEETKSQPGHFKWPRSDDIAEVCSQFVFRWDFDVEAASSNCRIWKIPALASLERAYARLRHSRNQFNQDTAEQVLPEPEPEQAQSGNKPGSGTSRYSPKVGDCLELRFSIGKKREDLFCSGFVRRIDFWGDCATAASHPAPAPPRESASAPPRESASAPPRESAPVPPRESAPVPPMESAPHPVRAPPRESAPAPPRESAPVPPMESAPHPVHAP
ncbi:hypothetical protein EGW08_018198 [Elysia chlorotica]|uniref:Uncharacterized protein n=1 Tax=Elysia chlorotica TaxID=188477 RepID=A0A3S1B3E7_ELYCH|nr:hypothetical protein EGW08_018198 [Elysia chlorotica]